MRIAIPSASALSFVAFRALATVLTLSLAANSIAFAAGPPMPLDPIKLKQTLMTRGIGMEFKIKELDGTRVTGILTGIHDESFEITAKGTTQAISIPYGQVSSLRNVGSGGAGSTAGKIAGGLAIGLGAFCVLVVGISLYALHGG